MIIHFIVCLLFLVLTSVVKIKDNSTDLIKNEKGIESIKRCLKLIENVSLISLRIF